MRERLTFRGTAVDGTKVNLQKAMRIKIANDSPEKMFIVYTHNAGEAWQEVNIGKMETVWDVHLKSQYSARQPITSAKLKNMRNLCSCIPLEYQGLYTGMQAQRPPVHVNPVKLCCHIEPRMKLLTQNLMSKYHQVTVMMMNKVCNERTSDPVTFWQC